MSTSTRKPMPTRSGHLRDEFNPETLMALNALSRVIGSDMSLDALLNATVPLIKQLLDVDICLILLHERDQARLSLRASVPRLDEETFDLYPADVPPEAWSCIRQVVHQDGRQERFEALKEVPGMALISGPLIAHDEHLGLVYCYAAKERSFSSEDYTLLYTIANVVALAIRQQRRSQVHTLLNTLMDNQYERYLEQIRRIAGYDRRKEADLLHTLETFLQLAGDMGTTARELRIHRNTLKQRIDRMQSLCAIDLHERGHWFALQLAIKVYRQQENVGA